jgi:hypothetical protein
MLPGLDRILHPGDALVVISALPGLRKVESGRLEAPSCCLELKGMGVGADRFTAQMLLARHLNQPPGAMASFMDFREGPRWTPMLHQGQAQELVAELKRLGIVCKLIRGGSFHTP